MTNESPFSDSLYEQSIQTKMEKIWSNTCGSWKNCNETTILAFLSECNDYNLDSQYCMSWVEQHKEEIPNWTAVSEASLDWVNQHTSTGSPYSASENTIN